MPILEPKMEPKRHQKRTKIEDKNEDEKRQSLRSSWSGLGAILDRSWDPSWVKKVSFTEGFHYLLKNRLFEKIRLQEATWAELGPTWETKVGRPKGSKIDPESEPRRSKKRDEK